MGLLLCRSLSYIHRVLCAVSDSKLTAGGLFENAINARQRRKPTLKREGTLRLEVGRRKKHKQQVVAQKSR